MSTTSLKLVLTTTSLRNVTFATPSDEFYYEIITRSWDPAHTQIKKHNIETREVTVIAELEREESHSKVTGLRFANLTHPGEDKKTFSPPEEFFMVENDNTDGKVLGTFTGNDGKPYRWKEVKGSVELFRADEADGKSLARFHKHHRHLGVLRLSKHPVLEVASELCDTMDTVIVSFLMAEGKRR